MKKEGRLVGKKQDNAKMEAKEEEEVVVCGCVVCGVEWSLRVSE
jgi:hypothetical protein